MLMVKDNLYYLMMHVQHMLLAVTNYMTYCVMHLLEVITQSL